MNTEFVTEKQAVICGMCTHYNGDLNRCRKSGDQRGRHCRACGSFKGKAVELPNFDIDKTEETKQEEVIQAPEIKKQKRTRGIAVIDGKKVCTKCGRNLPLEAFPKDKLGTGGRKSVCKECKNSASKLQRDEKKNLPSVNEAVSAVSKRVLSTYSVEELISELKAKGVSGTLTYNQPVTIVF